MGLAAAILFSLFILLWIAMGLDGGHDSNDMNP